MTEVVEKSYNELINTKPSDIVSFGYDWLDNKLTGIFKSDLIVMGGESGTGKTTFATNIIYKASQKHKCCIFALEDRLENYGIRAIYFELGRIRMNEGLNNYPWNDYRKNKIEDSKFPEYVQQAKTNLTNNNVYFCEVGEQMSIEVLERLLEQKSEEGIELFLIDHLHYFDLLRGRSSKADYIENTMVRLKTIQKKTGVRIILVVHYRKLEGRKPSIDSFKDSISIVQNADYVINLWRDRTEGANHLETTIMCPKSRNPNGEFTMTATFNPYINDYELNKEAFGTSSTIGYNEIKL